MRQMCDPVECAGVPPKRLPTGDLLGIHFDNDRLASLERLLHRTNGVPVARESDAGRDAGHKQVNVSVAGDNGALRRPTARPEGR